MVLQTIRAVGRITMFQQFLHRQSPVGYDEMVKEVLPHKAPRFSKLWSPRAMQTVDNETMIQPLTFLEMFRLKVIRHTSPNKLPSASSVLNLKMHKFKDVLGLVETSNFSCAELNASQFE